MKQYKIVGVYKSPVVLTCEHCGRPIKNIVVLKDNVTGEILNVGTTCIYKILDLNLDFDKALQKEINKYYKCLKEYEFYKDEESAVNSLIADGELKKTRWEQRENDWVLITIEYLKELVERMHHIVKNRLNKQIKIMNRLDKKGLIKLDEI